MVLPRQMRHSGVGTVGLWDLIGEPMWFGYFPICRLHMFSWTKITIFCLINSPFVQFISSLYTYIKYYIYIYIKFLHISTYLCCVTPTFSSGAPSFPSIAPEKYEAGPPCWRRSVQGRGTDLTATETREWWLVGVTIPFYDCKFQVSELW
jgi:hypothetical protein